ncbi:hypothetical protein KC19_1G307000 [Ceratodon purpureus]|uniref:Fungal lipase-type domain-containing protein n=1 Tax=Ceratodon purpureus TaxID=3225 RepID=A0A8T0JB53_CERPU|nr:hypothetical protein KC19_1G307000 [Ceratodon purpureus]
MATSGIGKVTSGISKVLSNGWTEDNDETPTFMAAQPRSHGHSLSGLLKHGQPNRIDATFPQDLAKQTWQQKVSMICVKLLWRTYTVMKLMGFATEWTLNFLVLNNGILGLFFKLITFRWGSIVIPKPGADNFLSMIGHMDPRCDLYVDTSAAGKAASTRADALVFPDEDVGSRRTADVCVLAAKLAYENPNVVKRVVEQNWKMHFVKFFNCWNEYQKMHNTQAFMFMDKPKDANAVVVAFRGTEAFNTYDWSTDFDFSWVKLDGLGGVHLGFLEALGLVTREDPNSLRKLRNNARTRRALHKERGLEHEPSFRNLSPDQIKQATVSASGLPDHLVHNRGRSLAFDDITSKIAEVLHDNPNAKLFFAGHSLGGALACLYPVMLQYTAQTEMINKIGAIYTFGQPRVGDAEFRKYANDKFTGKYFRVVYCNDMVPRIPFDNELMQFKHFGDCEYFNSVYDGMTLKKEPNPNYFGFGRMLTMHLNAAWEVFYAAILIRLQHGKEYSESNFSLLSRVGGLMVPGVAGHSLTNYVNAVRLGPFPSRERVKEDVHDFHVMSDNFRDIISCMYLETMKILGLSRPKNAPGTTY